MSVPTQIGVNSQGSPIYRFDAVPNVAPIAPLGVNAADYAQPGDGGDLSLAANRAITAVYGAGGGLVRLPAGTFPQLTPITVMPGVTLEGPIGRVVAQPGTEVPLYCYLQPAASFSGAAAILMLDKEQGGYSGDNNGIRLRHIALDGSLLTGTSINGIQATGRVHDVMLENVSLYAFPHNGVYTSAYTRHDSTTYAPYSWSLRNVVAHNCLNNGFSLNTLTDSELVSCLSLGSGVYGYFLAAMANSRFIGCHAEWSVNHGFYITGNWQTGTGSGGATFVGCSTDRNNWNGVYVDATGNASLTFSGHMARRDGRNNKSGGNGYAGFAGNGTTMPIVIDGYTCYPGVDDDGTGTNSPDYGASFTNCTSVSLGSGYLHAQAGGWHDGGGNTVLRVSPFVGTATGSTAAPTRSTGEPAATDPGNNGTITTTGATMAVVNPAAAETGWILSPGTAGGQVFQVINVSTANSGTFAAAATSHVADGTSDVLAANSARTFVWSASKALWFPSK